MPAQGYTYNPVQVREYGRDRMRFELGDVMVEGGPATTALTDAEIDAIRALDTGKGSHDPEAPGVGETLLANYKIHD